MGFRNSFTSTWWSAVALFPVLSIAGPSDPDWFDAIDGYHSTNGPMLIGTSYLSGTALDFPAFPITVDAPTGSFPLSGLFETELYGIDSGGNPIFGTDFVGTILNAKAMDGSDVRLRINQITPAADASDINAYSIDQWIGTGWAPLCGTMTAPILAIPIGGTWNGVGVHSPAVGMTFACLDGAAGKCLFRHRYRPWIDPDHENLLQSCTRMVRADYCGDGSDHTLGGTRIISGDWLGQHIWDPNPGAYNYTFEAGWGPNGADCVNAQRHTELLELQHQGRCPVVPNLCETGIPFVNPARVIKNKCEPMGPSTCVPLPP